MKFLQKTEEKNRRTFLGVAVLLFVGLFSQTAVAATVYETSPGFGSLSINFQCGDSTCRANQPYVSLGGAIPVGISFDRIRVLFTGVGSTTATRMYGSLIQDENNERFTCDTNDVTCWNDVVSGYSQTLLTGTSMTVEADGWQSQTFALKSATNTEQFIYLAVDPNSPYQSQRYIKQATTGFYQDGNNDAGGSGSFVYQLCNGACDDYGSYIPPPPSIVSSDYSQTRFISLNTSSTTGRLNFNVSYYISADEVDYTVSARNPQQISVALSKVPDNDFTRYGFSIPLTTGTSSFSESWPSTLVDGTYDLQVKFSNVGCTTGLSECPFAQSYIFQQFTIVGGIITSSTTPDIYDASRFASWDEETPYYDCGVTDISGCLKNVVVWAFVPGEFSTDYFSTMIDYAETKTPFVYMIQFSENFQALATNASGTMPEVTVDFPAIGEITLLSDSWFTDGGTLDTLSTLLRTGSVGIFYLMLSVLLYKRSKRFIYGLTNPI